MSYIRFIIDLLTDFISYCKKNRRIQKPCLPNPIKLNLGCGLAVADGWINLDGSLNALVASLPKFTHKIFYRLSGARNYYSQEQYCDILAKHCFVHCNLNYGIPFLDNSVDFIFSSHFLEHMFREDALRLLADSYRVLKPGGIIRIAVPDLEYAVAIYSKGKKKEMLTNYFFVEDKGSFLSKHKYMYDFALLEEILSGIGFLNITRKSFQIGNVPNVAILDNRPDDSLFVEAER